MIDRQYETCPTCGNHQRLVYATRSNASQEHDARMAGIPQAFGTYYVSGLLKALEKRGNGGGV